MAGWFADGVVGVWFSTTPDSAAALAEAEQLLSGEERQRAARFVRAGDRDDYIWSHARLRQALAAVAGRSAREWRFAAGPHGKPHVVGGPHADLEFNLTHTRGCCACAIGRGLKIGIDVERAPSGRAVLDIARRFFDPAEADLLAGMGETEAERHFLEMWTLKEAYVKAMGVGLSLPQPSFASFRSRGDVRMPAEAAGPWWFWLCAPAEGVTLSVAASPVGRMSVPQMRFIEPSEVSVIGPAVVRGAPV